MKINTNFVKVGKLLIAAFVAVLLCLEDLSAQEIENAFTIKIELLPKFQEEMDNRIKSLTRTKIKELRKSGVRFDSGALKAIVRDALRPEVTPDGRMAGRSLSLTKSQTSRSCLC